LSKKHELTLFFSNSNISPREEYEHRLGEARKLAAAMTLPLVEDQYDHKSWLKLVAGLENEPERGKRCEVCFAFSLGRTARYAAEKRFDGFTTTLTVSPHKHSHTLFSVGKRFQGFEETDFKKRGGFKHSIELARKYGLARQDYCGCEFSRRRKDDEKASLTKARRTQRMRENAPLPGADTNGRRTGAVTEPTDC
jgi:predicted adenine nucleotide alpha hydrolase (AANH) superfamily ATPase